MKKIILAIFLFSILGCKSQIVKTNNMENFDLKKFRENNSNENHIGFLLENGDKVQQFTGGSGKGFVERIEKKNIPFTIVKAYHENTVISSKGEEFYDFPIGTWQYYNEIGNLIKEVNYDKEYKFSISNLAKKMKDEYKIDILLKSPWIRTLRDKSNIGVIYKVIVFLNESKYSDTKNYIIDGNTGKTISEKVLIYQE